MIIFKRNENTGIVEIWKSGKKIGEIETIGDEIIRNYKQNYTEME